MRPVLAETKFFQNVRRYFLFQVLRQTHKSLWQSGHKAHVSQRSVAAHDDVAACGAHGSHRPIYRVVKAC